jgi:hypothetical protein
MTAALKKAEAIRNWSTEPADAKKLDKLAKLFLDLDDCRRVCVAGDALKIDAFFMAIANQRQYRAAERMIRFCRKNGLPLP